MTILFGHAADRAHLQKICMTNLDLEKCICYTHLVKKVLMLRDCLATKQNTQELPLLGISSYYGLIRYQLSLLLIMWSITSITRQMIKSIKVLMLLIVFASFLLPV